MGLVIGLGVMVIALAVVVIVVSKKKKVTEESVDSVSGYAGTHARRAYTPETTERDSYEKAQSTQAEQEPTEDELPPHVDEEETFVQIDEDDDK